VTHSLTYSLTYLLTHLGDRVALCVSNLDPKSIERGIATSVGLCSPVHNVLCLVKQIRFYKNKCKNNTKFHISVGHQTVLGNVTFFGYQEINKMNSIGTHCHSPTYPLAYSLT
jgi:selenocysteine-specific translation elongation factor